MRRDRIQWHVNRWISRSGNCISCGICAQFYARNANFAYFPIMSVNDYLVNLNLEMMLLNLPARFFFTATLSAFVRGNHKISYDKVVVFAAVTSLTTVLSVVWWAPPFLRNCHLRKISEHMVSDVRSVTLTLEQLKRFIPQPPIRRLSYTT